MNMSQSPYSNLSMDELDAGPTRNSVLAIIALVLGIVSIIPLFCLFPGSGALAVIFGGAAILMISRERGRLGGTGMAATGIVLGILVTVVQITVVIGINSFMGVYNSQIVGPVDEALEAVDQGDFSTARKLLTPEADAATTDQQFAEFAAAYKASVGSYRGSPDSVINVFQLWVEVGRSMQALRAGASDIFPFPANFAKRPAIVIVVFDPSRMQKQQNSGPANFAFPTRNLGILTVDGEAMWLNDALPASGVASRPIRTPPAGGAGKTGADSGPAKASDEGAAPAREPETESESDSLP